jgi:hypothetical protein
MGIILKAEVWGLKISLKSKTYVLIGFDAVNFLKKNKLVFCDLSKDGFILIKFLKSLNIEIQSAKIYN